MSIDPKSIKKRWDNIRDNEDCNLSLTPESVAGYLREPEGNLVEARITESLIQFANYRVKKGFISKMPAKPGDMATCEGLEAFFIPAVERALPFSAFLEKYGKRSTEKQRFIDLFKKDIQGLLENWEKGIFSGQPYADTDDIYDAIQPTLRKDFETINITEAAAMACRVLIHLLTLKLTRPEEAAFQQAIGDEFDDDRLFTSLTAAIDFLIRAFKKGDGQSEDARIVNAKVGNFPGSGWSWTDRAELPPMLFFTAAAVDAFAELDLYLIRAVLKEDLKGGGKKLETYYNNPETRKKLDQFQLCVDMSRRWVQKAVLPDLINGYGQHVEKFPNEQNPLGDEMKYDKKPEGYEQFEDDLKRVEKLLHPPMVFYNNLYVLLILLWSWGDWDDAAEDLDDDTKSSINRALAQLVYNYSSIPVVKEILNRFPYIFYLPGRGLIQPHEEEKCKYMDSAFLPLLTRLLVLFVVYGVGDRNLLEPVIRDLYVELLQNRYRGNIEQSALWSADKIEVFSTQRAIQALTFYYAYARGKERVEGKSKLGDTIMLRNKTEIPMVLELISERPVERRKDSDEITAENFYEYGRQQNPKWRMAEPLGDPAVQGLLGVAKGMGDQLIKDYHEGKIRDAGAARLILNSLMDITTTPLSDSGVRESELALLKEQHKYLSERSNGHR